MTDGEWLSVPECARQAGISPETLRRHLLSGRIEVRFLRVTERTIRVHRAGWAAWLTASTISPGASPEVA